MWMKLRRLMDKLPIELLGPAVLSMLLFNNLICTEFVCVDVSKINQNL